MKKTILALAIIISFSAFQYDKPAYKLFNGLGAEKDWSSLIKSAEDADVILFGELHNNVLGHWLQLQLLKDLQKTNAGKLIVGAEMFEADDQIVLTEFLNKKITETHLESEAKLWPNYKVDYKPFFSFAFKNQIPVIATNIPRRYASAVSKRGLATLDSVDAQAKNWFAPLPIKVNYEMGIYKEMDAMNMGSHGGPTGANMVNAQATKDATMAYFIAKNYVSGKKFIHLNGSFHSKNHQGIVSYLLATNPKLKVLTISMTESADLSQVPKEDQNSADYIFVFPEDTPKSY